MATFAYKFLTDDCLIGCSFFNVCVCISIISCISLVRIFCPSFTHQNFEVELEPRFGQIHKNFCGVPSGISSEFRQILQPRMHSIHCLAMAELDDRQSFNMWGKHLSISRFKFCCSSDVESSAM